MGSQLFVVDADVATSMSSKGHPPSPQCATTLLRILSVCHRVVLGKELHSEWNEHARGKEFARWKKQMLNRGKVKKVSLRRAAEIAGRLRNVASTDEIGEIMARDAHLIAAALEHGARVLSCDRRVRHHLRTVAGKVQDLDRVVWADPTLPEENIDGWLDAGAPAEDRRMLGWSE